MRDKLTLDEAVEMLKREAWGFKHADGYCPAEDGGCELCCSLDELSELFKPVLIKALRGKEGR